MFKVGNISDQDKL